MSLDDEQWPEDYWQDDDDCGFEAILDEILNEPFGSCEICGVNLYPGDDEQLCPQCEWRVDNGL